MNNFYLIVVLFGVILTTGRFTLGRFLLSIQRDLHRKTSKDVFLGDTAEALIRSEKAVAQRNLLLTKIQQSCPAILLLPAPAMAKALNAGRSISRTLKLSQDASRVSVRALLASAQTRGFQTNDNLAKERTQNVCHFEGPIKNLPQSHVEIYDDESGIQLRADPEYLWNFKHASSRNIWF